MRRVCFLLLLLLTRTCLAEIYVVTHADNPLQKISEHDLRDLYLGRSKAFPNGEFALVLDREESSVLRETFFEYLSSMNLRQVDAYWARLVFAGRMLPLEQVPDSAELERRIRENVNAIGYLSHPPESEDLKPVYVISDSEN